VRATEKSGVRSAGSSSRWALVLVVLTALAVQLSALTATASAEDVTLVDSTQDEAVTPPVAGDDGTTSESPAANPVLAPEVTSPEPAAPSGQPATVESSEPNPGAPARPPLAESDSPDPHAGGPTGPAQSSPATTSQIQTTTPAVPEPLAPPPAAGTGPPVTPVLLPVAPESPARPRGAAPMRARGGTGVATMAWGRPRSLVSGVTVRAWGAVVEWGPPPVSLPAPRAKSPADPTTKNLVRQSPPERPPPVPRAPSSSMCGGASSCGAAFLVMLPLFMGIVCLCASLFQRLAEAPELWRSTRFLTLRERPG
jgi:hypothetical protein